MRLCPQSFPRNEKRHIDANGPGTIFFIMAIARFRDLCLDAGALAAGLACQGTTLGPDEVPGR
jgi:hypothetical protein